LTKFVTPVWHLETVLGGFAPRRRVGDNELVQLCNCFKTIFFPRVGLLKNS